MRPDPTPTDARLFPLEPNATADLDAKALDEIRTAMRAYTLERAIAGALGRLLDRIAEAVISTGREV